MKRKTEQTLCPYTGTMLGTSGPTNREHVTPIAIGAPEGFWVESHEAQNSHWNALVDAPFSNDEGVRFLSMANKVKSRSGEVVSKVSGSIIETGESVKLTFASSGMDIDFTKPVVPLGKTEYLVKGFGDKAVQQSESLQKNLARKGQIADSATVRSLKSPTIHSGFSVDLTLVERQLKKTAYLYTVWCLGDHAIASPSRDQYLSALGGGGILSANIDLSDRLEGYHQFTLLVIGDTAYCETDFFGVFKGLFVTTLNPGIELFAQHSKIDLKNKRFDEDKDSISLISKFAQRIHSMQLTGIRDAGPTL